MNFRRTIAFLLSITMAVCLLCSCANSSSDAKVSAPDTVITEDQEPVTVPATVAEPEAETEPEITTELEKTTEPETTPEPTTTTEPTTVPEETTPAPTTEAPATTPVPETEPEFEVEPMSAVMYANATANVRRGPGSSYERVGHVDSGDKLEVTGKTANNWYRIKFKGGEYFVGASYLSAEKPLAVTTAATTTAATETPAEPQKPQEQEKVYDSTMDFVLDMGIGINLGNTLEACGSWINGKSVRNYETAWGSPVVTQAMIQGYADGGFGVMRIPVAWSNMMDENYNIAQEYMDRVKEVAGWATDSGMKAIINIHWDGGWFDKFSTDEKEAMKKYEKVWKQICEEFKYESPNIMFEAMNEVGWDNLWNQYNPNDGYGKKKALELLNRINQKFVDVVRASGGNNSNRHLLVSSYYTSIDIACDSLFVLPNDPANRLAISVHYYTPATFCILTEDASWGKAQSTWGTDADYRELSKNMDMMVDNYVSKGIPVIVGEFGCSTGNKTPEMVRKYMTSVCEAVYTRGMCPVIWDTPGGFYDRKACKFSDSELLDGIMKIKKLKRN